MHYPVENIVSLIKLFVGKYFKTEIEIKVDGSNIIIDNIWEIRPVELSKSYFLSNDNKGYELIKWETVRNWEDKSEIQLYKGSMILLFRKFIEDYFQEIIGNLDRQVINCLEMGKR